MSTTMCATIAASELINAGRAVSAPFELEIPGDGGQNIIQCTKIFRVLPGRRLVARGRWRDQEVVLKLFLGATSEKYYLRENCGIERLHSAGLPTPKVLNRGRLNNEQAHFIIFEYCRGGSLRDLWDNARDIEGRRSALEQAMAMLARMHTASLYQGDLHLDNFLLVDGEVFIIDSADIHQCKGVKGLTESDSLKNLALLIAQLPPRFESLAISLFPNYCIDRQWSDQGQGKLQQQLTLEITSARKRRQNKFLAKTLRDCTQFIARKTWREFMVCQRQDYSDELAAMLADPDRYIAEGKILKDGNSATVAKVVLGNRPLVIKRYNIKSLWHRIRRCLRPSRAITSWCNANLLCHHELLTPHPVASLEKRWGPFRQRAYFITDYINGIEASDFFADDFDDAIADLMGPQFETLFKTLEKLHISHGDCKARNFLIVDRTLHVIDLDAMQVHGEEQDFIKAQKKDLNRFLKNWDKLPRAKNIFEPIIHKLSSQEYK